MTLIDRQNQLLEFELSRSYEDINEIEKEWVTLVDDCDDSDWGTLIQYNLFRLRNLSKLNFPLKLRKWKNGDKIQPLGMKGNKKVSDILIDYKISILEKENIYVLESNNDIVWVIGILINEVYKVDNNCSLFYKIVYREN